MNFADMKACRIKFLEAIMGTKLPEWQRELISIISDRGIKRIQFGGRRQGHNLKLQICLKAIKNAAQVKKFGISDKKAMEYILNSSHLLSIDELEKISKAFKLIYLEDEFHWFLPPNSECFTTRK